MPQNTLLKVSGIGIIIMLSLFSKATFSRTLKDYSYLYENNTSSENYEIVKLIDGDINGLLVDNKSGNSIISAGGFLWKISPQGYIIDTYYGAGWLYKSGIIINNDYLKNTDAFHKKTFSDWLYTGNHFDQILPPAERLENYSQEQLVTYLQQAEISEYLATYDDSGEYALALLKLAEHWQTLDLSLFRDLVDSHCNRSTRPTWRKHDMLNETCFKGVDNHKKHQLQRLQNILPYRPDFKNSESILYLQKFSKRFHHFEEGIAGWALGNVLGNTIFSELPGERPQQYWYGDAYFNLKHDGETLKFKALVAVRKKHISARHISIFDLPNNEKHNSRLISIVDIGTEANYLYKDDELAQHQGDEVGLYVLRKKAHSPYNDVITSEKKPSYQSSIPWHTVVTGMQSYYPVFGKINFFNSDFPSQHYLLNDAAINNALHAIPKDLSLHWTPEENPKIFKLMLTNNETVFLQRRLDRHAWPIKIVFNEKEIIDAFKFMHKTDLPLTLEIAINETSPISAKLSIQLKNTKQIIKLKKSTFIYKKTDVGAESLYEQNRLTLKKINLNKKLQQERTQLDIMFQQALTQSLTNTDHINNYMSEALSVANNSPTPSGHAYYFANSTTKLLIRLIQKQKLSLAKDIFLQYTNEILPLVGRHEKTSDVASIALVLGITTKNNKLASAVFEHLLDENIDVTQIKNEMLLYNMACYYSWQKDKPALLLTTRQALKQGKTPQEFLSDSDFKSYWQDKDFLNELNK